MATAYLAKYGNAVVENGYAICFIRPGEKRPFGKDWESKKYGPKSIQAALDGGRGDFGVGIKTKRTPGVDIDCYDTDVVDAVRDFTVDLLGDTLERVGQPPKTLLVYRASTPFPKTQSAVYIDDEDRAVKLEVLGDGQQFVALHVHPDTKKPYRWKDKRHPGNVERGDLPEITQDDALAIVAFFEKQAETKGWIKKSTANALAKRGAGEVDLDDPFISDKAKIELTAEELRAKLDLVPNPQDYDQWFYVGMALHHQFSGSQEGLLMWHEWSTQASNYDMDALDEKWPTFEIEGKKREPLTARYILKQAQAEEERISTEEMDEIKSDLEEAGDMAAIRLVCERVKGVAFDTLQREVLAQALQKRVKAALSTTISISAVRQMIRYENPEHTKVPAWLSGFVYVQHTEQFYQPDTRVRLSVKAFDASYSRYMMTKKDRLEGRSSPEHAPSHVALNRYEIDAVNNVMYLPDAGDIFEIGGVRFVNGFNEATLPETREELTPKEKRIIARIERHFEHLFQFERDRKLLLSWMAYIVQTNKRSNWCPMIQGAEGDGKTTLAIILQAALGPLNFSTINGENLSEQYTPWAENSLFCAIEEVRLHGANRYDVLNKVKPYISNTMVPIRVMRTNIYNVHNTVNYMMFSNSKTGLPINENDTRYYLAFSRWQTQHALDAFKRDNPDYYAELAEIINYGSAIRRFLLDYELSSDFDPNKRAPGSHAKREAIALNKSEEDEALDDVLTDSSDPTMCRTLLDTARLADAMEGVTLPYGRALSNWLTEYGFTFLGRPKIGKDKHRLWSQEPHRFQNAKGEMDANKVRRYIEEGGDFI